MDPCYIKLAPKSTIRLELLEFCINESNWIDPNVGTFFQTIPPKDLIYKDPFLKHLCDNCLTEDGFDINVKIFVLKPWSHYMLHSDRFRSASVNLLINDVTDSISYFQISEPYKMQVDIKELKYEPDCYYLFNSRIPHAITNRTPERYLLSLTLKDNYYSMLKYFSNQTFL